MIIKKTPQEISIMKKGGKILAKILDELSFAAKPGIATEDLNKLAEKLIFKYGAKPSFKEYEGYPFSLCVSINEEVVHGIPSKRKLKKGDIVSLDLGIWYEGLCTDAAVTVGVGKISKEAKKIIKVTEECLEKAVEQAKIGGHLGDISTAVQNYAESFGFSVVRDLVGHGVGRGVHEDPEIPNFGQEGSGINLEKGMTLAIEPMLVAGNYKVRQLKDGWTFVTSDKSLSAHFEHTVAVGENGGEILTQIFPS
jgi:methionyl aminopeptidase